VRTDQTTTDVYVTLEDALGRALPPDGLAVSARTGQVEYVETDNLVWRGVWTGLGVEGRDVVTATWMPTATGTVPAALYLDWDPILDGEIPVRVRVLDRQGRPVPGVRLAVEGAARAVVTESDVTGWAVARVAPPDEGPVMVTVRSKFLVSRRVFHRGQSTRPLPGGLMGRAEVTVEPGRANAIVVRIEPQVLRAGPAAAAEVTAWVEDPSGAIVRDLPMEITAPEGAFGPVRQTAAGQWVRQWTPGQDELERPVQFDARAGGLRTTAEILVQPRSTRVSLGPWAGVQTNLGGFTRPVFGLDFDVRTRALGESVVLHGGLAGWTWSAEGGTPTTRVDSVVVPGTAAVLFRSDHGRLGAWAGLGFSAGLERLGVQVGGRAVTQGLRFVVGPTGLGGLGLRAGRNGEAVLTIRATWLSSASSDVASTGNVAGVAAGLGYRLVY
jgi:hypothetical protein